mmetsp:Transcript_67694/g.218685  ORF Transcript_67694/g.218685 Transcript_67694/m.218685 type:complete len:314 (-) Transcript_67694:652-1593(-)
MCRRRATHWRPSTCGSCSTHTSFRCCSVSLVRSSVSDTNTWTLRAEFGWMPSIGRHRRLPAAPRGCSKSRAAGGTSRPPPSSVLVVELRGSAVLRKSLQRSRTSTCWTSSTAARHGAPVLQSTQSSRAPGSTSWVQKGCSCPAAVSQMTWLRAGSGRSPSSRPAASFAHPASACGGLASRPEATAGAWPRRRPTRKPSCSFWSRPCWREAKAWRRSTMKRSTLMVDVGLRWMVVGNKLTGASEERVAKVCLNRGRSSGGMCSLSSIPCMEMPMIMSSLPSTGRSVSPSTATQKAASHTRASNASKASFSAASC